MWALLEMRVLFEGGSYMRNYGKYFSLIEKKSLLPTMAQSAQTVENTHSFFNVSDTLYKSLIYAKVVFFEPQLFSWLARALKGNEVSDYCTRTPISTVEFIVQLQFRFYLSIMTFQLDFLATCCGAIVTNSPPIFYYGPVCCYG